ncbi:MAG: hypothetical protein AB2776_18630 [Candidatus Thiodiazotropha endolucinida]
MSKITQPSIVRLQEILRRQDPPGWRKHYIPAILAERAEAPPKSRFARVWSPVFQRHIHVLSRVELATLFIILYYPNLIELQEQRMLAMEPRPHPLEGHPAVTVEKLPSLQGTVAVASRIDCLYLHPTINVPGEAGDMIPAPFPWIGDFLLFLLDEVGPYCVNLTVKDDHEDFGRSTIKEQPVRNPERDEAKIKARHAIEEIYYRDASIPTVRVVKKDLPKKLIDNLRRIYLSFCKPVNVDDEIRKRVLDRLQGCLLTGKPPLEAFLSMKLQFDIPVPIQKILMEKAIWRRELRVELFGDPVFPDQPLLQEKKDVVKEFANWFIRG